MSNLRQTMADMEKDARLTFRMPQVVREALERAAEAQRRSVSDLGVIILNDWLVERGYLTRSGVKRKGRA